MITLCRSPRKCSLPAVSFTLTLHVSAAGAVAVQYFDETTEDWILDMSKRTGRPVNECKAAGARHCAGQTFAGRSREINRAMTFAASTMRRDRDLAVPGTDVPTVIVEDVAEEDDK